jgi:hypothetical protein
MRILIFFRFARALQSFIYLRPKPVSAIIGARDFVYAHFQLDTESKLMQSEPRDKMVTSTLSTRLRELQRGDTERAGNQEALPLYHVAKTNYLQRLAYFWRVPRARRALTCATTVMVAQQLTGVNTLSTVVRSMTIGVITDQTCQQCFSLLPLSKSAVAQIANATVHGWVLA